MSTIGLALVGVALGGCGQKGALYLPTDPAAANRATLPQLLVPGQDSTGGTPSRGADAAPAPAAASSTPAAGGTK